MTSREFFETARDAAKEMERARSMLEMLKGKEGLHSHEGNGSSGISDPMSATDMRMDAELEIQRGRLASASETLEDAWDVVGHIERMRGGYSAQIVSCHWLWLMSWPETGHFAHVSEKTARVDAYATLEWIDGIGMAHLRDESGIAES